MASKIVILKNGSNEEILPKTSSLGVYMTDGKSLEALAGECLYYDTPSDAIQVTKPEVIERVNAISTELVQVKSDITELSNKQTINDNLTTTDKSWSSDKTLKEILKVQSGFKVPVLTEDPVSPTEGDLWIVKSNITNDTVLMLDTLATAGDINLTPLSNIGTYSLVSYIPPDNMVMKNLKILMSTREADYHNAAAKIEVVIGIFNNNTFTPLSSVKTFTSPSQANTKFTLDVTFDDNLILTKNVEYFIKLSTTTVKSYISVKGNTANYRTNLGLVHYDVSLSKFTRYDAYDPNIYITGIIKGV